MKLILSGTVRLYQFIAAAFSFFFLIFGIQTQCKYPETCSHYALRQLNENSSVISACYKILLRLLSCGPWANVWLAFSQTKTKVN